VVGFAEFDGLRPLFEHRLWGYDAGIFTQYGSDLAITAKTHHE
jgi:hypothetical protein